MTQPVKFLHGSPEQPEGNAYIFARVKDGTYCIGRVVLNVYRGVEPRIAAEIKRVVGLDSLLRPEGLCILVGYDKDDTHLKAQAMSQGADTIYLEGDYDSSSVFPAVREALESYVNRYSDMLYQRQEDARAKAHAAMLATRSDGSIDELTILNAADSLRGAAASALQSGDQSHHIRAMAGLEFLLGKLPSIYAEHATQLVSWTRTGPHNESYGPTLMAEMFGIYEKRARSGENVTIKAAADGSTSSQQAITAL